MCLSMSLYSDPLITDSLCFLLFLLFMSWLKNASKLLRKVPPAENDSRTVLFDTFYWYLPEFLPDLYPINLVEFLAFFNNILSILLWDLAFFIIEAFWAFHFLELYYLELVFSWSLVLFMSWDAISCLVKLIVPPDKHLVNWRFLASHW